MSRAETGAGDGPAIGAARLEEMFDGLRREVVLGVSAPASAEVVRRGVRRRRRRVGAVTGAGVLGAVVLWSSVSLVPPQSGRGVAAPQVRQTVGPLPTEQALPVPQQSVRSTGASSLPDWVPSPVALAEPGVRALLLGVARLPSVLGGYGPWTVAPVAHGSASASTGASTSASTSASVGTGTETGTGTGTGSAAPSASPSEEAEGGPASDVSAAFAGGCVSGLVRTAGAEQVWGEGYQDVGGEDATAHQYVLRFGTARDAEFAGARLLAGGGCVTGSSGWVVEQQLGALVALGVRQPVPYAEEAAVHVSGSLVAVLTVHRVGRGVSPGAGLSDRFRAAAVEFLALGEPAGRQ